MNFNKITRYANKLAFRAKKASPTLLTVAGIGALLGSTVLAVKETPKVEPVVDKLQSDLTRVDAMTRESQYMPEEEVKAKMKAYGDFGLRVIKIYGPSVVLAAAGTAAILSAHGVMKRREASLIAAYGVLERAFNGYRERVRDSFGEDVETDLYSGKSIKSFHGTKEGEVVFESEVRGERSGAIPEYVYDFGPANRHWSQARPEWNLTFLRGQESYANDLLQAKGHLFLNDVLDSLGYPDTPAGAVTGWLLNGEGDGYISFDLFGPGSAEEQDYLYFFNGENDIRLEFNVDGVIWDKI